MSSEKITARQRLNDVLAPLARRIPFSPNSVTVSAFVLNLVAAAALASGRLGAALASIAVLTIAGLLDALDGAIARTQNKQSRFGDFLDHFLDRVSDAALFIGWSFGVGVHPLLAAIAVASILLAGYIGTQIEASFGVRSYEGAGRAEYLIGIGAMIAISYAGIVFGFDHGAVRNSMAALLILFVWLTIVGRLRLAHRLAEQKR